MAKNKGGKPAPAPAKGSERRNGKASKKHPKTGLEGANGKTVGGYSPSKIALRAAIRATGHKVKPSE